MIALSILLAAATGCTRGSEYEPPLCPTGLPAVRAVTITRTGATSDQASGPPEPCATFRPSPAAIRRYLTHAGRTDWQAADATVDWSHCYAEGTVRFADGRTARWRVQRYRLGELTFPGWPAMLLYCRRCGAPFAR